MDDTSIKFRLRLAQINGINLDEAAKKVTPEHLTPEYKAKLKELQATVHATREEKNKTKYALYDAEDAHREAQERHDKAKQELLRHNAKRPNYYENRERASENAKIKKKAEDERIHKHKMATDPEYVKDYNNARRLANLAFRSMFGSK